MKQHRVDDQVLVINAGSSSVKFSLLRPDSETVILEGDVDRLGTPQAVLSISFQGNEDSLPLGEITLQQSIQTILKEIQSRMGEGWEPAAIGHRMVHGAEAFKSSSLINPKVIERLKACNPMAPLHNPSNLQGIETCVDMFPDTPQVAVMDTAFHQTMPPEAFLYAIPYSLYEENGIRRYGFHGTSHQYVCTEAAQRLNIPLDQSAFLSAHLGNGCSATAVKNGKSMDTTMGLTPLEGLVMGTRSGDVDPSLHKFLADHLGYSLDDITSLLNKKSGLLGLSGTTQDMRELVELSDKGDERAALAIDVFCYRLAKHLAGLMVPLGSLDALIFTGGIGTYSSPVREKVVSQLSFLGCGLDPEKNREHGKSNQGQIQTENSPAILVIKTNEEAMIARQTWALLQGPAQP